MPLISLDYERQIAAAGEFALLLRCQCAEVMRRERQLITCDIVYAIDRLIGRDLWPTAREQTDREQEIVSAAARAASRFFAGYLNTCVGERAA